MIIILFILRDFFFPEMKNVVGYCSCFMSTFIHLQFCFIPPHQKKTIWFIQSDYDNPIIEFF